MKQKPIMTVEVSLRIYQDLKWCADHGIGGSSAEEVAAYFIQNGVVRLIEAHVLPLKHDKPDATESVTGTSTMPTHVPSDDALERRQARLHNPSKF